MTSGVPAAPSAPNTGAYPLVTNFEGDEGDLLQNVGDEYVPVDLDTVLGGEDGDILQNVSGVWTADDAVTLLGADLIPQPAAPAESQALMFDGTDWGAYDPVKVVRNAYVDEDSGEVGATLGRYVLPQGYSRLHIQLVLKLIAPLPAAHYLALALNDTDSIPSSSAKYGVLDEWTGTNPTADLGVEVWDDTAFARKITSFDTSIAGFLLAEPDVLDADPNDTNRLVIDIDIAVGEDALGSLTYGSIKSKALFQGYDGADAFLHVLWESFAPLASSAEITDFRLAVLDLSGVAADWDTALLSTYVDEYSVNVYGVTTSPSMLI